MNREREKTDRSEAERQREREVLPCEKRTRRAEALVAAGLQPLPMASRWAHLPCTAPMHGPMSVTKDVLTQIHNTYLQAYTHTQNKRKAAYQSKSGKKIQKGTGKSKVPKKQAKVQTRMAKH